MTIADTQTGRRRDLLAGGRATATLVLILLLAACDFSADQVTQNETAAATGNQPVLAPPVPPPPPQPAVARRDLAVEAAGLRVVDETGATRPLPFGMAKDQLLAILEAFRGPADGGTNSECGAGPLDYAVWADGLTLHFQDNKFAGWALDQRAAGAHATVTGIGPGSTRRALAAAHEAQVEQTTLGTEFTAGGLYGILDGPGPDARIDAMWAGVSCVFR